MDDSIFGVSGKALQLCEQRAVLLTDNIVNSSTPHYKARDIDFHKMLRDTTNMTQSDSMLTTNAHHIVPDNSNTEINKQNALYRVPMQKSLDGNTVDEDIERKSFIENSLRYQVNLTFVQNESSQLMKAIKGD